MNVESLRDKLKILCESIPQNQWRYFNKRTIENYINNIEYIKGNIDRTNVQVILSNYLDDVELNFEPNIYYSIGLNNKYLQKVRSLYRELGFALVPGIRLFWLLLIIIIIIAFFLKKYFYLELLFLSTLSVAFLRMLIKLKQNKTYGVGY